LNFGPPAAMIKIQTLIVVVTIYPSQPRILLLHDNIAQPACPAAFSSKTSVNFSIVEDSSNILDKGKHMRSFTHVFSACGGIFRNHFANHLGNFVAQLVLEFVLHAEVMTMIMVLEAATSKDWCNVW
jgi:hypothetical protein